MLLSDWYFCSCARLRPDEAHAYLDLLTVIREPAALPEALDAAIQQLGGAERLLQIYAVPQLVRRLRRSPRQGELPAATAGRLGILLRQAAGAHTPPAVQELLMTLAHRAPRDIADTLAAVNLATATATASSSYLQLTEQSAEVAMLALLREAAADDPEHAASALRGQDFAALVATALHGLRGRLPQLLAVEAMAALGEPVDPLLDELWGTPGFDGEAHPDVQETTLRLLLTGEEPREAGLPAWLVAEAADGRRFDDLVRRNHRRPGMHAFSWLRLDEDRDGLLPFVLWQSTLVSLAAEIAPVATADWLGSWWLPPESDGHEDGWTVHLPPVSDENRLRRRLQSLLRRHRPTGSLEVTLVDGSLADNPATTMSVLHSPWLDRVDAKWHPDARRDTYPPLPPRKGYTPPPVFSQLDDPAVVLRFYTAVEVVRQLVTAGLAHAGHTYLLDLLLNFGDAFATRRLRIPLGHADKGRTPGQECTPLPAGLASLGLHARTVVERLGKGVLDERLPAAFAARLVESVRFEAEQGQQGRLALAGEQPRQRRFLFTEAAVMVAVHWAFEALSGTVAVEADPDEWGGARAWFAGDVHSPAADVVSLALTEVRDYLSQGQSRSQPLGILEAVTVAQDAFPALPALVRLPADSWAWTAEVNHGGTKTVSRQIVSAAGPLDLSTWQRLDPLPIDKLVKGADLAALTQRAIALLSSAVTGDSGSVPAVSEDHPWLVDWQRRLSLVNDRSQLARDLRTALLGLLGVRTTEPGQARALRVAQEGVIDALTEFSVNAPHYLDLLVDALQSPAAPGVSMQAALQLRLLRGLLASRLAPMTVSRLESPWVVVSRDGGEAQREVILERFMARLSGPAGEPADAVLDAARAILLEVTDRTRTDRLLVGDPGSKGSEPRLLLAAQQRDGRLVELSAAVDLRRRHGAGEAGVVDLFEAEPGRADALTKLDAGAQFSAVVAGRDITSGRGRALINYGAGRAVWSENRPEVALPPLGSTLVVQTRSRPHSRDDRPQLEARLLGPLADSDPVTDICASAHVRHAPGGGLRLEFAPDEIPHLLRLEDEDLVRVWDADLSRTVGAVMAERASAAAHGTDRSSLPEAPGPDAVQTLVRWDTGLGEWVPQDRSFAHLIAEGFAAPDVRTITLAFVEEIRNDHNGVSWRMSAGPGENYLLPPRVWTEDARGTMRSKLAGIAEQDDAWGLLVTVALVDEGGRPRLDLAPTGLAQTSRWSILSLPFDTRNLRWRRLFEEQRSPVAEREGAGWVYRTGLPDVAETLDVQLPAGRHYAGSQLAIVVRENGWGLAEQRRALVRADEVPRIFSLRVRDSEPPDLGLLTRLRDLGPGDLLTLETLRPPLRPTDPSRPGYTAENLSVDIARESLSLGLDDPPDSLVRGRILVVERVWPERHVRQVLAEPEEQLLLGDGSVLAEGPRGVSGIVVKHGPAQPLCEVWLEIDGRAHRVEVPRAAFEVAPQRVGDVVTVRCTPEGWVFRAESRTVATRALWTVEQAPSASRVPAEALYLGRADVLDVGWQMVAQDPGRPRVFVWPDDGRDRAHLEQVRGSGTGGVLPGTGRTNMGALVPAARRAGRPTNIIRLQVERRTLIGESSDARSASGGSWSGLMMTVTERAALGETALVDLHRQFFLAGDSTANAPVETEDERWRARYAEWLAGANRTEHASLAQGTLLEGGDPHGSPGAVLLSDLTVPQLIGDDAAPDVPGTTQVELLPGEEPWVRGRRYATDDVDVVLVPGERTWRASLRRVEPYTLRSYAALRGFIPRGPGQRTFSGGHMYFAGLTDDDGFRFEWGLGKTMVVPRGQLLLGDRIADEESFFFGDEVLRLQIEAQAVEGEPLHLRMRVEEVNWEIEHQVWSDAEQGLIQQLTVRVDPARRTVRPHDVLTRADRLDQTSRGYRQDRRVWLRNGTFDEESVEEILRAVQDRDTDSAEARGPLTVTVLARLDTTEPVNGRRRLRFTFLTSRPGTDSRRSIRPDDALFMIAGSVERKPPDRLGISNDCLIRFTLPRDLLGGTGPGLQANVMRRDFSLRESVLRSLLQTDAGDAPADSPDRRTRYVGHVMMVRITGIRNADGSVATGSTVKAPYRDLGAVSGWASGQPDRAYVTVGPHHPASRRRAEGPRAEQTGDRVVVEIGPGVLAAVPVPPGEPALRPGTTARLVCDGPSLRLERVVFGDGDHVPREGRPAILLTKDHVLRRQPDQVGASSGPGDTDFSVAGLPSIQINDKAAVATLAEVPHPRFAVVRRERGVYVADLEAQISAGVLRIDRSGQPSVNVRRGDVLKVPAGLGWRQLSFLDRGSADIVAQARRETWSYHDISSGHWKQIRGRWEYQDHAFPAQVSSTTEPVFFDESWSLRYRPHDIRRFGYPTRELLDLVSLGSVRYAVAGSSANGIWVERAPGRVVELPGQLLVPFERSAEPLAHLRWADFSPGDEVRLSRRTDTGRLSPFVLESWRPGPRGFFGAGRVLLPVAGQDRRRHALSLGTGLARLTVPCSPDEFAQHPVGAYRWLGASGRLTDPADDEPIDVGDVLLLGVDPDARFSVPGRPDLIVGLSRDGWDNAEWIRRGLEDPDARGRLLPLLGGVLPVVVAHVAPLGDQALVEVARNLPRPPQSRQDGSPELVLGRVLGVVDEHSVLIRSGRSLLRVDAAVLLPGVGDHVPAAIEALRKAQTPIWLHTHGGQLLAGLPVPEPEPGDSDLDVVPLLSVDEADGIICREVGSQVLRWLPISAAGWVRDAEPSAVFRELADSDEAGPRVHQVRLQPEEDVSIVDSAASRILWRRLEVGAPLRVQLVEALTSGKRGTHRYLGRIYPDGGLLEFHAEAPQSWGSDEDPVRAEVQRRSPDVVSVVERGTRRTRLDLPAWIPRALREAGSAVSASPEERLRSFSGAVPARFAEYSDAASAAARGEKPWDDQGLSLGARLVAVTTALGGDDVAGYLPATAASLLAEWLRAKGTHLFGTVVVRPGVSSPESDDDLAVYVAATLLLHALPRWDRNNRERSAILDRGSVHAARQLGRLAAGSLHVEAVLDHWLLAPDAAARAGQWLRLASRSLGGVMLDGKAGLQGQGDLYDGLLTPEQAEQLRLFTDSVASRGATVGDEELVTVALALEAALGLTTRTADLVAAMAGSATGQLAALARGLAPSSRDLVAQPRLLDCQAEVLAEVLDRLLRRGLPMTVLAHNAPPRGQAECEQAEGLLREVNEALAPASFV